MKDEVMVWRGMGEGSPSSAERDYTWEQSDGMLET